VNYLRIRKGDVHVKRRNGGSVRGVGSCPANAPRGKNLGEPSISTGVRHLSPQKADGPPGETAKSVEY